MMPAIKQPNSDPVNAVRRERKILVADDDPIIRTVLSMELKRRGYQVLTAADASAAIAVVRDEKPDLILLDIFFPPDVSGMGWDGFRIVEWLRRTGTAGDIPIFIISSAEPAKYRDCCLAAGATSFFQKPIKMPDLLDAIHDLFGEKAALNFEV